ncbi:hypothetical protein NSK_004154 [Nannochloropsis salina CCMP1776]|uniref:Molybdate-anion transporter n=1 Tax=Nannochloropsis salina CCMP1776 TaxID=1027361 RepID=A0A4D9CZU4_9STRA|nr:hypothetical protein NSK_004154 [Nannochloropsis salina CCMP1776]|eukprot:TFJ84690.1 hypothetical protein NSK_004154 [Nannochloropsis salina CCMP1776]
MFSDWIQGPYSYALYAHYGFTQGDIALLYMGGFLSSMVAGSFVGALADNYGRKKMCVVYAAFYIISCLVKLVNNYYILMFGRFFAGVATSLLFSAFEAWMVCEHNKRGFNPEWLSETFGYLTLGNGFVAVMAGLVANFFAERYGYIGPFVFCLFPLTLVGILATLWWPENYGDANVRPAMALPKAWSYIQNNSAIIYLGLGQSCFEGAMYAFVFVWTPALQAGGEDVGPYLGIIFSTFMVCTMTGSNIFSILIKKNLLTVVPVMVHLIATLANLTAFYFVKQTSSVYVAFLLFELTVGMFYPSYGSIKSMNIPEEVRSGVMNIFRIPLNAIMVVLLGLIEVKQISMGTTLALCTLIHGVGLIMYWNFERLRKRTPDVHYVSVKGQEVLDDAM